MAFYDEMAVMALEMITEFGQPVTIRATTVGEYDPETGTAPPDSTKEQTAQGILLDFTGQEFQNNSLIKQGDKKLKIAAQGLEWAPDLLNKVIVNGRTWSIVPPLKEINPAGTPILYELQVRSVSRAGAGQSGSFALNLAEFAAKATEAIDASLREIVIELGNSVIRMSPVGNPEIWAANVVHREANTRAADDYDFKVNIRNTIINLDESNFTKAGKLRSGVKYAKPLTKAEREQNFNVNGLVAGKGYVGGRFRGNWMFSIGAPDSTTTEEVDPSGAKSTARIVAGAIEFKAGDTCYITNSLGYAIPLEFGHSTQAPGGMVRITVARFQQIVLEAIRNNQV